MTINNDKMIEPKTQDINSKVLKEARKALKLNQQELADMLGSHQTDISKLENGKKIPDWLLKSITLGRLLERAGYSLNDLILSLPDPSEEQPLKVSESSEPYKV